MYFGITVYVYTAVTWQPASKKKKLPVGHDVIYRYEYTSRKRQNRIIATCVKNGN